MTECRSVTLSRLRRGDRGNLLGRAKHYLKHVAPVRPARANCKVLGLSSSNLQNCAASWIDATKGGELLHVYGPDYVESMCFDNGFLRSFLIFKPTIRERATC